MKLKTKEALSIKNWYLENQRPLPWRQDKDPYRIWISEMMLQQTTVTAVIPYFHRFLEKFPNLKSLQRAPIEHVLESWAGLGYYTRARHIHQAAQALANGVFPESYMELMRLPGFGPYTARAVSSLAFGEKVGVVDGNVIRVLSRYYGLARPWWSAKDKMIFQEKADQLAQQEDPSLINQGLMELGATICTPKNPTCPACPLKKNCRARLAKIIHQLPLKKPKKKSEIWVWEAEVPYRNSKVGLIRNAYLPFLRGQLVFPGQAFKTMERPKEFDVRHGITHHEIFVRIKTSKARTTTNLIWIDCKNIKFANPSSLLIKVLESQDLL